MNGRLWRNPSEKGLTHTKLTRKFVKGCRWLLNTAASAQGRSSCLHGQSGRILVLLSAHVVSPIAVFMIKYYPCRTLPEPGTAPSDKAGQTPPSEILNWRNVDGRNPWLSILCTACLRSPQFARGGVLSKVSFTDEKSAKLLRFGHAYVVTIHEMRRTAPQRLWSSSKQLRTP